MAGPGRLLLWDIDGTLVRVGDVGRAAVEAGAALVAGLTAVPNVDMAGKTDPQIVREILTLAGLAAHHIDRLLPDALAAVARTLADDEERVRRDGVVMPGVRALLARLAARGDVRQTVVTGNVAGNAVLKTAAFGLDEFLDFEIGAYGTDHEDRNELVPLAMARAGSAYDPRRVWVIGDTPRDLACAQAAGVRCILVGTGRPGFDALAELPADAVVKDLTDTDRIESLVAT